MRTDKPADEFARKPFVVGVTGGSGSGKTLFAKRLCERLGANAVGLSHDDYYKNLPSMTDEEALAYDFDSPDALDTHLLVEHLRALVRGEAIDVPDYDFASHSRVDGARHVEPAPIIVVEGMLVMCEPELAKLFDLTVFIDADPDIRVIRRFERDCRDRGADLSRAIKMYLGTAKPAHERYVEPCKAKADIVVRDASNDAALEVITQGVLVYATAPLLPCCSRSSELPPASIDR